MLTAVTAPHQVLVRCRPQLPHEAAAAGGSGGSRTPKPFTPRAMLPRPRSRTGLDRTGDNSGGGAESTRSSLEGNAASQPAAVVVHDAGAEALGIVNVLYWHRTAAWQPLAKAKLLSGEMCGIARRRRHDFGSSSRSSAHP